MKTHAQIADLLKEAIPLLQQASEIKLSDDSEHTYPWREADQLVGFVTAKFITFLFPEGMDFPHGCVTKEAEEVVAQAGGVRPNVCYGYSSGRREVMISYRDILKLNDS